MTIKKYLEVPFTLIAITFTIATMPFTLTIRAFRHIIKEWRVQLKMDKYVLTEHHPSDGLGILGGFWLALSLIVYLIALVSPPPYPLMSDMELGLTKEQVLVVELAIQQQHYCSPTPDNNSN